MTHWHRVATVGLDWPQAGYRGSVRAPEDIDPLVRDLLARPQIRAVVADWQTDDPTQRLGLRALARLWGGSWGPQPAERWELLKGDLNMTGPNGTWYAVDSLLNHARLFWVDNLPTDPTILERWVVFHVHNEDRPKVSLDP